MSAADLCVNRMTAAMENNLVVGLWSVTGIPLIEFATKMQS